MNWFTECWKPNFSVPINLFYLLCSVLLLIGPIWGHGGHKDGHGEHKNRKQENYHFHEGSLVGQVFPSKSDGTKALADIEGNSSIKNTSLRESIKSQVITQFLPAERNTCQLISRQGDTHFAIMRNMNRQNGSHISLPGNNCRSVLIVQMIFVPIQPFVRDPRHLPITSGPALIADT